MIRRVRTVVIALVVFCAVLAGNTITGGADPVSGVEGTLFADVLLASFSDSGNLPVSDYSGIINYGDGTPPVLATIVSLGGNIFGIDGGHDYTEAGSYAFSVLVSDNTGANNTFDGTATIADAPLTPSSAMVQTLPQNIPFNGPVAAFTDANPSAVVSDFTALINWGDGTPTNVGTVVSGSGVFNVDGAHTYASPGAFSISVQITDVDGSTAAATGTADVSLPEPSTWLACAGGLCLLIAAYRRTSPA